VPKVDEGDNDSTRSFDGEKTTQRATSVYSLAMCGINAIFAYGDAAPAVDREELIATREHMHRRGPDAGDAWFSADGRVGLGHRRLAIIDLSPGGAQPKHFGALA